MAVKFSNNATSTLTAGITNSATSLTVTSAALFPTLGVGDYTYVTLVDAGDSANFEIVKVTAISGNTFTITRAQQGTTAKAFSSGDAVALRVTAGLIEEAIGEAIADGSTGATLQDLQFLGGTGDQGTVSWNTDEETLDIIQNGAVLQVGQEIHYHVRNNTASTISNGTPVMVTGTLGSSGRLTVAPMDATDPANDVYYIGIATEDIAADTDGKVTHFGKIRGINTSTYTEGDVLWISTSVVGGFTTTEPTSGIKIPAAIVISSGNNGTLFCRFQGSYGLHDLHDTAITSPVDNELLAYDGTSSTWINQTPTEAGFATVATSGAYSDLTGVPTIVSFFTNDSGYLTNITGQSIENLSDVNTMTPTDGQVLTWDNANTRWDAADASVGGISTGKAIAMAIVFG